VISLTNSDCSNQNEAATLLQEDKFRSLDQELQHFIGAYSQGQRELKGLILSEAQITRSLITAEHQETRAYTRTTQEDLEFQRGLEKMREQLLKSLKDEDMNARKNQIGKADGVTFSSVFDSETDIPWQGFTDWLCSDAPLYWISGKAGSGKSTLVKFLFEDERTKTQLENWRTDCAIYAHFIWSIGTLSQRSIHGLLRSLLYQILYANRSILGSLLLEKANILNFTTPDDWSRQDLETVLLRSLSLHERGVCIFVDGLDEIDQKENPFDLLKLMKRISHYPKTKGVKLCVSSRPEPSFIQGLQRFPKLRLQDLTRQDMQMYAKNFLQTSSFDFEGIGERHFVDRVVDKADGVFLWVSLVLKSLQRGIANGDDPKELMQRLETLPSELGKLFEEMLKRIGDDQPLYRKEAALNFNMYMAFNNLRPVHGNLFQFAAAVDPSLRDRLLVQKSRPSAATLKDLLLAVDRRLTSRCAGLLETFSYGQEKDIEKLLSHQVHRPWESLHVALIHRSAKEFLLNKENMILDADETTPNERNFRMLQGVTLEYLYPPDAPHLTGQKNMLGLLTIAQIHLSDEQQYEIFNLAKDIYQRNGWPDIYEDAAIYALDQCLEPLREGRQRDQRAVKNYLLLCLPLWSWFHRSKNVTTRLIEMGADPNAVQPHWIGTRKGAPIIGCPIPVLGEYLLRLLRSVHLSAGEVQEVEVTEIEEDLTSCLHFSSDVEHKFLHYEDRWENRALQLMNWRKARTSRLYYDCLDDNIVLVEINIASLIQRVIWRYTNDPAERSAMASRIGLDSAKAHYRMLLYWHEETVYAVGDEESRTLQHIGVHNTTNEAANQARDNLVEKMKGKEVNDVRQWLVERGHKVVEENDVEGISENTSFEDMAEIYWKLNEKYGVKRKDNQV
jgi:hypothetical protein